MNAIKGFVKRFFNKSAAIHTGKLTIYEKDSHKINRRLVSRNAIKVCDVLQKNHFQAYIVGGAVRDLILGLQPKDFDVATNATPEEVKRLLRRARIIGKRFKLVHVLFGREIIETSTFRRHSEQKVHSDEFGRILSDNNYGTIIEDAERRDFTLNALYYDPTKEQVLDYHQGIPDLSHRVIRMIGDPELRYREDPVRILRAVRFAAKLNGKLEAGTAEAIPRMTHLISHVPESRLFDETFKLLTCGNALECLQNLRAFGVQPSILPLLDFVLQEVEESEFLQLSMERTDQRIRSRQSVSPSFLYAAILWPRVQQRWQALQADEPYVQALIMAANDVLDQYAAKLMLQKRHTAEMREIWFFQVRFEKLNRKSIYKLIEQRRFRAAVDFLQIRAAAHEFDSVKAQWWMDLADAESEQRELMINAIAPASSGHKHKRKRRHGRRRSQRKSALKATSTTSPQNND
ncbi:polynucleotide adenylyltransferase PcnB [Brackiella oedipodis]|uniref:polynucleotide adenylyltransferase PcnB n=1 Tax=Brackiella oedipodis TaxID=124225 RepID=UPI0004907029|nr:polynucleotide adenylyltransferase PcnB [Brackiella oedipodis]